MNLKSPKLASSFANGDSKNQLNQHKFQQRLNPKPAKLEVKPKSAKPAAQQTLNPKLAKLAQVSINVESKIS